MKKFSFLKYRNIQTALFLLIYLFISSYLPVKAHQILYTISLLIKDLLVWMLPVTVFFFIASTIQSFQKKALFFLCTVILFEAVSNGLCTWYAYGCAHFASLNTIELQTQISTLTPLFRIQLYKPLWWTADKGSMLAIIIGLFSIVKPLFFKNVLSKGKNFMQQMLTRFFSRLIPIYLLGFFAHMHQSNLLQQIYQPYASFILKLIGFLLIYLFFLFVLPTFKNLLMRIKNLIPAALMAFTSGCSLSTMPWTIDGASKNMKNPSLGAALIPMTTNIQQVGDCIINCFLCCLIYQQFYHTLPSFELWIVFSFVFTLARFATAAVMGGAIFLMLPIYETYLQFNPEMIALILAFNVILDPIVTSSNVIANGALSQIFEKLWDFLQGRKIFSRKTTNP